ncbi:hypothetical protein BgiMline_000537, partial [Biomphalaria glabrata]
TTARTTDCCITGATGSSGGDVNQFTTCEIHSGECGISEMIDTCPRSLFYLLPPAR